MSLESRLIALVQAIGADVKSLRSSTGTAPTVAWVNSVQEADALPPGTLAIILGSVGKYLQTWADVTAKAATEPIYIAHRGGGTSLAKDGAISSVEWVKSTGLALNNMIVDGGDGRVSSNGILVVSHDDLTGTLFDQNLSVTASTAAALTNLNFRDFPLYRGTISTEKMPTMLQYLTACKAAGIFAVPEIKTDAGATLIRDIVVELGMQTQTQVQAFASTAAQANLRLGPSRAAGISVGLLQNTGTNNIGFPAIKTCVNGGAPDVVLYDPAADPGNAWISAAIAAGIKLQVGTIERHVIRDAQRARVEGLGGKVSFFVSDDPFYTAGKTLRKTASNFSSHVQHGLIESDTSAPLTVNTVLQRLQFHDADIQFSLWGELSATTIEDHWRTLEYDLTFDALDTEGQGDSGQRWFAVFFGVPDDASLHDGVQNPSGAISFHFRQSGYMDMYNRTSSTVSTRVASTSPTASPETMGARRDTNNAPVVTGQTVRIRIENLVDSAGVLLNQVRVTRLDTGQWIQCPVGSAPLRGGYVHFGRNGTFGLKNSISNVTATYRS